MKEKIHFKTVKKNFAFVWEYKKSYIIITILVNIIQGVLPAFFLKFFQIMLNAVQRRNISLQLLLVGIIIYVVLKIVNLIIMESYSYYSQKFRMNFSVHVDTILLSKAGKLKQSDFETENTYNVISRAQSQGGESLLIYLELFIGVFKSLISIVSIFLIVSTYRIWIVAVTLIVPVIQYWYSVKFGKMQYEASVARTGKERKAGYIEFLMMTGNAFKELKLNSLMEYFVQKYNGIRKQVVTQDCQIARKISVTNKILGVLDHSISGGIIAYLFVCAYKGILLIGDVATYINCIEDIKGQLVVTFTQISVIYKKTMFMELLFDYLELPEDERNQGTVINKIEKIQLKNVSYKYAGTEKYVLKDINLLLERGKITGIIGGNGSGKSTLIKVILGFYPDYEGEIFINDIPFGKVDIVSYMKNVGCVFQDYIKYETDLEENISYGDIEAKNKIYRVQKAAEFAGLPKEKYIGDAVNEVLGSWFGTKQLSIGEWQRVAIARAFYKEGSMYVLDEPDASLDVIAESHILGKYKEVMSGKMGIFVTHEIKQVHLVADEIVVLKNGEIIQKGTHENLLKEEGIYKNMYLLDMKRK